MEPNNNMVSLIKNEKVIVRKIGLYSLQNVALPSKNEARKMLNGWSN